MNFIQLTIHLYSLTPTQSESNKFMIKKFESLSRKNVRSYSRLLICFDSVGIVVLKPLIY